MYITTIYSKLSIQQKKKINNFLKNNFDDTNKYIQFELEPMTIIILEMLDDNIVGCVCLYDNTYLIDKLNKNNIPHTYYSLNNSHGCFIYNLCVHKDHRNKKIGFNLIQYTINKMKELNIDYLHTQATNEISQTLFLKCGFMDESTFNDNIHVMSKYL
jgi:ribosomal protein S18 acetylase RimI-like enzyme